MTNDPLDRGDRQAQYCHGSLDFINLQQEPPFSKEQQFMTISPSG